MAAKIYTSRFPDLQIPDQVNLADMILEKAVQFGNRKAMVCSVTGREYTYTEMAELVKRTASALLSRGIMKGDIVCIFSPNCPEYSIMMIAVILLGGIVTTVNHLYTPREVIHQLHDSHPVMLMCGEGNVSIALESTAKFQCVKEVVVVGQAPGCTPFSTFMKHPVTSLPAVKYDSKNDIVLIPYSSGTTGNPKGVMLTHHGIVANFYQSDNAFTKTDILGAEPETYLCVLPLYHMFGIAIITLFGFFKGNKIVYIPRFEIDNFLEQIEKHKVTVLHIVPPICIMLTQYPNLKKYDLSSLHLALVAAAPLKQEQAEDLMRALNIKVRQAYGMTELSPIVTMAPIKGWKHGEAGMLVPNTECKVVDVETGALLGDNQDGELWFRGAQVMKGYWRNPQATAITIDKDNFLHSGDIGHFDDEGHLFVVDRLKELIKYNAYQVAPAELEGVLLTHPLVADAAVIGVPDVKAGELPKAYVVLKAGEKCSEKQIQDYVAERVGPQKRLRGGVQFVDSIPKSPSGKILRRILRDQLKGLSKL